MKHLLLTTIAAVVMVGCGESSIRIEDAIRSADPPARNIWQAAADGKIDAVKYHLAAGVDVNVKMKNILGTTPLHEAVRKNQKEIVELLIAEGANVNSRDGTGETALYQAAHRGYLELCKLLINNGADLNISTSKITMGHSPLYFAIRNRHADVAELLITSGADVNIKNGFGESPMDMAVHFKLQNIVNLLIEHGAEASALKGKEKTDETAKPTAFTHMPEIDLSSLQEEQLKTILERANKEGCNCGCKMTVAECRNDDTTCRRSVALAKAIVEEVTGKKYEVKADSGKTGDEIKKPTISIWRGAEKGDIEAVKEHLAAGTDVNAMNIYENTPLHSAAWNGHTEIIQLLIAEGANVNAVTGRGETPLDWAEKVRLTDTSEKKATKKEIAGLLRQHGGKTLGELKAEGK